MKNASQLFLGLLSAVGTTVLVLSAASLALLEGGAGIAPAAIPATQTPVSVTASPLPIVNVSTPLAVTMTATATPTEALHCQNTPADWAPYAVQPGDTITSLVTQSGAAMDEFLKANCFVSATLRLEPGWVVFLPPTAPTATVTMTPTPELPTPTSCGAPYGWVNYIVQPGDTLFRLSLSLGISQYQLQSANCLTDTRIYAGQMLRVPFIPVRPPIITLTPTLTQTAQASDTPVPTFTNTPVTPVGKQNQSISFDALPDQVFGDPAFSVNASASSGLPVSFSASGNCTIAGATVTLTGAGNCSITATQPGNGSYNPAAPVIQTFQIAKASQTIDFNPPADKTIGDPPFSVSASASSGLPVSFSASGSCSIAGAVVSIDSVGSCAITASQDGNSDYAAATPVTHTFQINQASQTITFGPLPDRTAAESPFTVSASSTSGLPVSFSASGNCTIAGSTVSLTGVGSCTVTASQPGDSSTLPAADVSHNFQIK